MGVEGSPLAFILWYKVLNAILWLRKVDGRDRIFQKGVMIHMASVNFEKLKTPQEVKAMLRHCDKEERKDANHGNRHIDKNATKDNRQMGRTYKETCKAYDERIAYLDSLKGANKRKDRVTCFGLEIPYPEDIAEADKVAWSNEIFRIAVERYGEENILQCYEHRDEKHEYIDAETGKKRMSRDHLHLYVIPEIDGRLNGKAFSSRQRIIDLNNAIQQMTQDTYGIDFMNGTKKKSRASVESLKQRSAERALQAQRDDLSKQQEKLQAATQKAESERITASRMRVQAEDRLTELSEKEQALHEREQELLERERLIRERNRKLSNDKQVLDDMRQQLGEKEQVLLAKERKLQAQEQKYSELIRRGQTAKAMDRFGDTVKKSNQRNLRHDGSEINIDYS